MRLVARGMSNKAIAQQLGISPRTVEGHLNHVFDKLDTCRGPNWSTTRWRAASSAEERGPGSESTPDPGEPRRGRGVGPVILRRGPRGHEPSADRPASEAARSILVGADALDRLAILATPTPHAGARTSSAWPPPWRSASTSLTGPRVFDDRDLLVPVLYTALNYGLTGAVFTAGWVTVLGQSTILRGRQRPQLRGRLGAEVVLLDSLAVLVGQRVAAEREARRIAEAAQEAHRSTEALYRDLFDSNQAPILIVDGNGEVIESNASAQRAFSPSATGVGTSDRPDPSARHRSVPSHGQGRARSAETHPQQAHRRTTRPGGR